MAKAELSKEIERKDIQDIRYYFAFDCDDEIGDLAGELILDFIVEKIGPYF